MTRLNPIKDSLCDDPDPYEAPFRVLVANETDAAIDAERIEAAVRAAFAGSPYQLVEMSVAIIDDPAIQQLNRQYLDHDYPTDVLSFALEDDPPRLEGEIVVSVDAAERCAREAGWSTDNELLLYVVHGALHLVGYADHSAEDSARMRSREAAALARLGVTLSPRDPRWHAAPQEDPGT